MEISVIHRDMRTENVLVYSDEIPDSYLLERARGKPTTFDIEKYLREVDITREPCPLTFKIADLGESTIFKDGNLAMSRVGNVNTSAP